MATRLTGVAVVVFLATVCVGCFGGGGRDRGAADTAVAPTLDLDDIQAIDDLEPFTGVRRTSFCREVLRLGPEDPEVVALHERLELDDSGYGNLVLGCSGVLEADAEAELDKSGSLDQTYRLRAPEWQTQARQADFDLYDTDLRIDDLIMVRRFFSGLYGRPEATLHIEYATAWNGGYSRQGSMVAAVVDVFGIDAFTNNSSGCGPDSMEIEPLQGSRNDLEAKEQACVELDQHVFGEPIFRHDRWEDVSTYTVTIGPTRIAVQARSETEALALLDSLVPVSVDEIDFFSRNI